ncbi:MAG: Alkaline phosphatase [uncultured Acetobacteraceae bacterium]|uniref:Alkaline phosphatase n=1 Tax=uncultured Acetobacteraceae bacterium TaxID=169975 RepID=A0A6J4ISE4_9PROT|nr:MAG: Alkaline phosphatase [uncultured Acetobacteraceae bacterium]
MATPGLPKHAPDELLVQFAPGATAQARSDAARALGGQEREAIHTEAMRDAGRGPLSVLKLPPGLDLDKATEALSRRPGVVSVDRNWEHSVDAASDDPGFTGGQLWGMRGDASDPANPFGTGAAEAWAAGHTGSTKAVAGVIDSGVDYRHLDLYLNIWLNQGEIPDALRPALEDTDRDGLITFRDLNRAGNAGSVSDLNGNGRIDAGDLLADARWEDGVDGDGNGYADDLIGWDFSNDDNDPLDDNRHGTHVAGTIAGQGGNGAGVAGVAWTAQIVALKFLGADGSGYGSDAVEAVDYFTAAAKAAGATSDFVATNNSWGGGGPSTAMRDAIDRGADQDILFVAAAGNDGADLDGTDHYPAEYDTTFNGGLDAVVAVAAITSGGALSSFSNRGGRSVDLGAPGSSIHSTVPDGGYASLSGTSMAAPHVTGAALLYAAGNPGASGARIRQAILAGAEPTASLAGKTVTGGRLDVGEMMSAPPSLAIAASASADAAEGASGPKAFNFAVMRSGAAAGAASVDWFLAHGTTDALDFAGALSGTVSFAAGETVKTVAVMVAGDTAAEADETFSVTLANAAGGDIGAATARGRIQNDDFATIAGTDADDVLVRAPGQHAYEGLGGRDTLDMSNHGFRAADVAAQPDGSVLVTHGGDTADLRGVEEVRFADGRLVFDAGDPAARVAHLYEAALDRLPDQGGLNFWIDAVQDGRPLSELARGFLGSGEFRARFGDMADNGAFVDRLYQNVLGRAGEAEGRKFWIDSMNNGAGRADVLVSFSESAENKAGTAALVQAGIWDRSEAAAEVARLYDTVFGRLADVGGLTYWKNGLEGGTATLGQMADAFTGSAEFRAQYGSLNNRQFADALYVNSLDRPADQAGLDYWAAQLDAGVARSAVVLAFSESAEHVALTAANIQSENPGEFGILFA